MELCQDFLNSLFKWGCTCNWSLKQVKAIRGRMEKRGEMGKFSHLSSDVRGGVGKAKDPPPTEIQAKEDEQPKG